MSYKIIENADRTQEVEKTEGDLIKKIKQNDWHDNDFQNYISWLNTGEQPEFVSWEQQQINALKSDILELQNALIKANILIERESAK